MRYPSRLLLLAPGPLKFPFISQGIDFYRARVKPYLQFEVLFPKVKAEGSPQDRRAQEAHRLRKHIPPSAYLLALDERGRLFSSRELARFWEDLFLSHREIVVVAGGPEGLETGLLAQAQFRLSLSPLTLNHEIALLVFCEALYRSLTILSGGPYHRP